MLKILRKREEIAPEEQFLPLSTIFYYLMLDFYVKTGIRFSLRDKRLFEITEVEITRVDCIAPVQTEDKYLLVGMIFIFKVNGYRISLRQTTYNMELNDLKKIVLEI